MKAKLLTIAAELAEDLTEDDYRCIYAELREKCSLRAFAEFISSAVSHAWWGRYENRLVQLNHDRRNELRRAVGLPELPGTVAQALGNVSPMRPCGRSVSSLPTVWCWWALTRPRG